MIARRDDSVDVKGLTGELALLNLFSRVIGIVWWPPWPFVH